MPPLFSAVAAYTAQSALLTFLIVRLDAESVVCTCSQSREERTKTQRS